MALTKIDDRGLKTPIDLLDNEKIRLGTGNDLQIYHDGFDTRLHNLTGNFLIRNEAASGNIFIRTKTSESAIDCVPDGAVKLYYDNSTKLETTSGGATVTGSLGIGTASPITSLHVKHATDNGVAIFESGDASGGIALKDNSTTNNVFLLAETDDFKLLTGGSERIRIDSSGRLLLGTTTEGHSSGDDLTIASSGTTGITIRGGTSDGGRIFFSDGTSGDDEYRGVVGYSHATNHMYFSTDATERMRIDSSGRVGIGTTSPSQKLHIKDGSANPLILVERDSGATTFVEAQTNKGAFGTGNNHPVYFLQNSGTAMVIDTNKKVGVNTTSPVGKLTVDENNASEHFQLRNTTNTSNFSAFGVDSSFNLRFYVNGSNERMRIHSGGQISIGNTVTTTLSTGITLQPNSISSFYTVDNHTLHLGRGGSNGEIIRFNRSATDVGSISVTTTSTAYNTSSDYRLKENVTAISDGITRLKTLKPSRFNFKVDTDTTVDGFLAHEVTAVPEAITGTKDEVDSDNKPIYQQIDQSKLVPLLTAALQEAIAKIETLETEVAALKAA